MLRLTYKEGQGVFPRKDTATCHMCMLGHNPKRLENLCPTGKHSVCLSPFLSLSLLAAVLLPPPVLFGKSQVHLSIKFIYPATQPFIYMSRDTIGFATAITKFL